MMVLEERLMADMMSLGPNSDEGVECRNGHLTLIGSHHL